MSQQGHTSEVAQSDSTRKPNNNHSFLNRLLLGLDVAILSAFLLLRFTAIDGVVIAVIVFISGFFSFLFQGIHKFYLQAWFQS